MSFSARQKKVRIEIEGAENLQLRLKAMGEAAKSVLLEGAKEGGKIALEDAIQNCPVDTGALKASLKLSDDKTTDEKATVKIDYDKNLYYGTFVELGTKHNKANPFMRNAVDKNQDKINTAIAETIAKAVEREM